MKFLSTIAIVAIGLLTVSCSQDGPEEPNARHEQSLNLSIEEMAASRHGESFAISLFHNVNAASPTSENLVVSPLSVQMLLGIIAQGACDQTAQEITTVLGTTDLASLNSLNNKLTVDLTDADDCLTISCANAMWYRSSLSLRSDYRLSMENTRNSAILPVDFSNAQRTSSEINAWVSEKTSNLIKGVVTPSDIRPDLVAIAANALYFKGLWANPFDERQTSDAQFHGLSGNRLVAMMHSDETQHYSHSNKCQIAKLQLGHGILEALFILPAEGCDINTFIAEDMEREITSANFSDIAIDLSLPRFKIIPDNVLELNQALEAMGLNSLNESMPQKMFTQEDIEIVHNILQSSAIEFNESGAEGAAVTWDIMDIASGPGMSSPVMDIDRPFVFAVRNPQTNAYLFIGKIVNL